MRSNELGADVGADTKKEQTGPIIGLDGKELQAVPAPAASQPVSGPGPVIDSQWKLSPDLANGAQRDRLNRSLFQDSIPPNFRLPDPAKTYGPQTHEIDLNHPIKPDISYPIAQDRNGVNRQQMELDAQRIERERDMIGPGRSGPGVRRSDVFVESRQRFSDQAADMIFPGFGRIESKDPQNPWRLDYLYSNRCRIKGLGACFSMKIR